MSPSVTDRIAIAIPAYQAAATLRDLLPRVMAFIPRSDIIVVDDGSDDDTAQRCRLLEVRTVRHQKNCGKGQALRTAFSLALDERFSAVITLDADGQHRPEYIPDFVKLFRKSGCHIIIGSRKDTFADLPWDRYLSNRLTTVVVSLLAGRRLEDSQSGYRLYAAEVLCGVKTEARRYEMESEFLIRAGRMGYSIAHLPIRNHPVTTSHIHRWADTLRFLAMALRMMWS